MKQINSVTVTTRNIGVVPASTEGVQIKVWAPLAESMSVSPVDGKKPVALRKDEFGYWHGETTDLKAGDLYKFIINEDKELPDPASVNQPKGVHGPSRVTDLNNFSWTDGAWNNLPLDEYIIYELHTGTFTKEGTFEAIEKKLDYLKDLGITAIEIMPVAQFPGNRNWGYDGVYPFAVQNSYGGPEKLQNLINVCHQKGLAVILDVVYNHLGPEGNYLEEFGPYFTDKYNTPWGKAINFDDAWCDGVRQYFIENVLMWFRDFHIDALRMDAVHAIKDFSPEHILKEIRLNVDSLMEETGRKHYLIIECDLNDRKFIDPVENEGFGMDSQWVDEFHHALRVTTGQERTGYYGDFDGIAHLAKAYNDAYVYDGIFSPHRHKNFGTKVDGRPGHQFIVFSQNHDQVGNRMLGERTSELVSFEMLKLMAASVIVSPFIPMLFMGEEWGSASPFLYFVSHTDPDLVEAVRKGRKAEFEAFHARGEAPDPQSEETFHKSKLDWEALEKNQHKILYQYYKKLIELRKTNAPFRFLNRDNINVQVDEAAKIITLYRWHEKDHTICLMNFSQKPIKMQAPFQENSEFTKIFDSADPQWNGESTATGTLKGNAEVEVQAESILIYSIQENV